MLEDQITFFHRSVPITCSRAFIALCTFSGNVECVRVGQYAKKINGHLAFCKISDDAVVDREPKLLLP